MSVKTIHNMARTYFEKCDHDKPANFSFVAENNALLNSKALTSVDTLVGGLWRPQQTIYSSQASFLLKSIILRVYWYNFSTVHKCLGT